MPITPLLEIMETLRAPDGCPWDRAQTHESLRRYCLEEAFEVVEAIDHADDAALKSELGDLLLQVVFHAQIGSERNAFDFADVVDAICAKMHRRHPHVFGPQAGQVAGGDPESWEAIKQRERANDGAERSLVDGVPRAMPALLRAQRVSDKAATCGFDWPDVTGVHEKIAEEFGELKEAVEANEPEAIEHEIGDLLLALTNLARHHDCNAEFALQKATDRFTTRFKKMEEQARLENLDLATQDLESLEQRWQAAKRET